MNEAAALGGIERERAKRRQAESAKLNQPQAKKTNGEQRLKSVMLCSSEKGKVSEAIGKKVGISASTTEKALKVKKAVDTLKAQGKTEEAEQVVAVLNKKGFHAAHKQVKEKGLFPEKEPKLIEVAEQRKYLILSNRDTRQRTPEQEGREYLILKDIASRREGKNKGGRPANGTKPQVISPMVSNSSPPRKGAGDIAAKQLNISRQKGERAAFAVQTMERLEAIRYV